MSDSVSGLRAGALVFHPEHGHGMVGTRPGDWGESIVPWSSFSEGLGPVFDLDADGWVLVGDGFPPEGALLAWVTPEQGGK